MYTDRHGWGPHICIGRPLARLGDYELLLERAERTRNPNLRGNQALPFRF
jgi:hypothetical protein